MGLFKLYFALCAVGLFYVSGFGVDPALHVDIFQEFDLVRSSAGVSQVHGFHNESRAYLFEVSLINLEKLESIVNIWFLEVESSGLRNEIRLFFQTSDQRQQKEVFPYSLADGHWHKVSLAFSTTQLVLHIDCNRIYERIVEAPSMDFPRGTNIWLGQRNDAHGFFRGVMQDVQLVVVPHGYIVQCPDLNRSKCMLSVDGTEKKNLALAEEKMKYLDGCYCERTCTLNGEIYRDDDAWIDGCRNCTCSNGTVECQSIFCPPPQCPPDTAPIYMPGACCKECQPVCLFRGRVYVEGDRKSVHDSEGNCLLFECRDRSMHRVEMTPCPELNCPESEQITLTDRCCKVCRGHDFCAEGHNRNCVENSDCINLEAGACCSCKEGYHALRDDSAYCQDIDECAEGKHYCRENTMCMNTPGSFMCVCHTGYVRIDDYSCTEHDECVRGLNTCDENALCFNTVGGHSCSCKPGYVGNGTVCRALCDGQCLNGGSCVNPDTCVCQQGFTGKRCETEDWHHVLSIGLVQMLHTRSVHKGNPITAGPQGLNALGSGVLPLKQDVSAGYLLILYVMGVKQEDSGLVMCRRMVCDCENPTVDVLCCPECDPRLSSQCLHQNGLLAYSNGETWVENCQQCQCMRGEVDCWPVSCAQVSDCEFTVVPEGECCPRCVTDPCLADTVRNDITKTCVDEYGITRFSGSAWTKHGTECSLCQCKTISRLGLHPPVPPTTDDMRPERVSPVLAFILPSRGAVIY
ncbi:Protein kinase C-binding protein NELL2 [Anabarilius grahami]|uniref:Protein kinase C-binding protein NELL2 n=1 Tax=Anabarilius grahami TaxID=495550 RepID=A0A3N0XF34_ANAGA|nr:Protein kinase C-binding protein NELL2 [Anabarilius grahami]